MIVCPANFFVSVTVVLRDTLAAAAAAAAAMASFCRCCFFCFCFFSFPPSPDAAAAAAAGVSSFPSAVAPAAARDPTLATIARPTVAPNMPERTDRALRSVRRFLTAALRCFFVALPPPPLLLLLLLPIFA